MKQLRLDKRCTPKILQDYGFVKHGLNYKLSIPLYAYKRTPVRITNHGDIWFYIIVVVLIKKNGKWSRVNFARSAILFDVIAKSCGKLHYQFLLEGTRWSHIIDLSVDQLSTLSIRKRVDIFNCIVV